MPSSRASLPSVLFCLLLTTLASASVEEVCKKITTVKGAGVTYDFCVRILESDPASATADERGLAVIAGNLGSKKARSILSKINSLLETATSPFREPLKDCSELYDEAVDELLAAAAAAKGNRYSDANTYFSSGMDAADTCEDGFSQKKLRSPLVAEDDEFNQMCDIGAALTYGGP